MAKIYRTPTTEKLAQALEELHDPKLVDMIKRARQGYYDDYKSPIADPHLELIADLLVLDCPEMATRAEEGEWNAPSWERREALVKEARELLYREWPGKKRKVDTI